MNIVINTTAAMDAELDRLAVLEGKSPEALGQELITNVFLENMLVKIRAARKAALMRVMVPVPSGTAREACAPIDWAAADKPLYPPINWPEKLKGV